MAELGQIMEQVKKKIGGLSDVEKVGMKFTRHESDAEDALDNLIEILYKKYYREHDHYATISERYDSGGFQKMKMLYRIVLDNIRQVSNVSGSSPSGSTKRFLIWYYYIADETPKDNHYFRIERVEDNIQEQVIKRIDLSTLVDKDYDVVKYMRAKRKLEKTNDANEKLRIIYDNSKIYTKNAVIVKYTTNFEDKKAYLFFRTINLLFYDERRGTNTIETKDFIVTRSFVHEDVPEDKYNATSYYFIITKKPTSNLTEIVKKIKLSNPKEKIGYYIRTGRYDDALDIIYKEAALTKSGRSVAFVGEGTDYTSYMSMIFGYNYTKTEKLINFANRLRPGASDVYQEKRIFDRFIVTMSIHVGDIDVVGMYFGSPTYLIKPRSDSLKEQFIKKIKLGSDLEDISLQNLLGKDINVDKYLKKMYEYKAPSLQDYIAKFHIPQELAYSFDMSNNGRVVTVDTKSGEILEQILQPYKQHKSGFEKTKLFQAEWERYITEDYIVIWVNLLKPHILALKGTFWLIKPKN